MDCIFSCFQDYIEQVAFKEKKKTSRKKLAILVLDFNFI